MYGFSFIFVVSPWVLLINELVIVSRDKCSSFQHTCLHFDSFSGYRPNLWGFLCIFGMLLKRSMFITETTVLPSDRHAIDSFNMVSLWSLFNPQLIPSQFNKRHNIQIDVHEEKKSKTNQICYIVNRFHWALCEQPDQ